MLSTRMLNFFFNSSGIGTARSMDFVGTLQHCGEFPGF
jgi:hypothetical protein